MEPRILKMERTEEEKQRRHLEGDKGAKYSAAKQFTPREDDVSNTLTSAQKDNLLAEPKACATRTRSYAGIPERLEIGGTVANAITSVQKDSMVCESIRVHQANKQGYIECPPGGVFDASYPNSPSRRGRVQDGGDVTPTICSAKQGLCLYEGTEESTERIIQVGNSVPDHPKFKNRIIQGRIYASEDLLPTLNTRLEPKMAMTQYRIRKLTPRECFRLMDVDDTDIDKIQSAGISKTQQYKMAGNSIVVSCLYHILRRMFVDTASAEPECLSLFD